MDKKELSKKELKVLKGLLKSDGFKMDDIGIARVAKENPILVDDLITEMEKKQLLQKSEDGSAWMLTTRAKEVMGVVEKKKPTPAPAAEKTDVFDETPEPIEVKPKKKASAGQGDVFAEWIKPALIGFATGLVACVLFFLVVVRPYVNVAIRENNKKYVSGRQFEKTIRKAALAKNLDKLRDRVENMNKQLHYLSSKQKPSKKKSSRRR